MPDAAMWSEVHELSSALTAHEPEFREMTVWRPSDLKTAFQLQKPCSWLARRFTVLVSIVHVLQCMVSCCFDRHTSQSQPHMHTVHSTKHARAGRLMRHVDSKVQHLLWSQRLLSTVSHAVELHHICLRLARTRRHAFAAACAPLVLLRRW